MGVTACGCGQCLPCRINRRRLWTHRLLLESANHVGSCFVTLTYRPENVPAAGTLEPRDVQKWLKRLRKAIAPSKVRYFLVGEYGDISQRPHYHAALFGMDPLDGAEVVSETWGLGHTLVGDLSPESAAYVAGYVCKKMTSVDDPRLNGRYPEFARMSLRPVGIGAAAMSDVSAAIGGRVDKYLSVKGDVPFELRRGGKSFPLGRYLRRVLRGELGFVSKDTPAAAARKYGLELRVLYEDQAKVTGEKSLRKLYLDINGQRMNNIEARSKLYASEKRL